jgi:hypothetical protein
MAAHNQSNAAPKNRWRLRSRRAAIVAVVSMSLAIGSAPTVANAAYVTYALSRAMYEYEIVNSSTTTILGGTAQVTSNFVRIYTQTVLPGVGIYASSYADNAGVANLSHIAVANAYERCFWDLVGGTIPGNPTISTTCRRTN